MFGFLEPVGMVIVRLELMDWLCLITVGLDTRLREICTAKRREMEVMLNPRRDQHDWKALARDLGNFIPK